LCAPSPASSAGAFCFLAFSERKQKTRKKRFVRMSLSFAEAFAVLLSKISKGIVFTVPFLFFKKISFFI